MGRLKMCIAGSSSTSKGMSLKPIWFKIWIEVVSPDKFKQQWILPNEHAVIEHIFICVYMACIYVYTVLLYV